MRMDKSPKGLKLLSTLRTMENLHLQWLIRFDDLVVLAERLHTIPFRTRTLRAPAPMVLCLKAWESRTLPGLQNVKINVTLLFYFNTANIFIKVK